MCRREANFLPGFVRVDFKGLIPSEAVRDVLSDYDVMLNPTRGESFGQAIGESLSAGTPVVVAAVTPWTSWIGRSGGGMIVQDDRLGRRCRRAFHRWRRRIGNSSGRGPTGPTRAGGATHESNLTSSRWCSPGNGDL